MTALVLLLFYIYTSVFIFGSLPTTGATDHREISQSLQFSPCLENSPSDGLNTSLPTSIYVAWSTISTYSTELQLT